MTKAAARVQTDRPDRYLTQMFKHFRHHVDAELTDSVLSMKFRGGTCVLRVDGEAITIEVEADSGRSLEMIQGLVGEHLERFGERDGLDVEWTDPTPAQS